MSHSNLHLSSSVPEVKVVDIIPLVSWTGPLKYSVTILLSKLSLRIEQFTISVIIGIDNKRNVVYHSILKMLLLP